MSESPRAQPLPAARVRAWEGIAGLVHGFLGRAGGVSAGPFASLNLCERQGDDPAAVAENRRRVTAELEGGRLVTMQQEHGEQVAVVDTVAESAGIADGLITARAGVVLGVLTADCVPILLVAPSRRIVAVVHAGWRGTVAGIAMRAVERLQREFDAAPSTIEAALGPAIAGCCYEVSRDIGEQFIARWGELPPGAWRPAGAKGWLDLRWANAILLRRSGLADERVYRIGPCTRCATRQYFSHRASDGRAGRQLSYIGTII